MGFINISISKIPFCLNSCPLRTFVSKNTVSFMCILRYLFSAFARSKNYHDHETVISIFVVCHNFVSVVIFFYNIFKNIKKAEITIWSFLGNVSKFPVSAKYVYTSFTYTVYNQKDGQGDTHELNNMPPSPSEWGYNCHVSDIT